MNNIAEAEQLTRQGIAALNANNKATAYTLLSQAIQSDPGNQLAWLWLSGTVDDNYRRHYCLQQAIAINPNNDLGKHALTGIERLKAEEQTIQKNIAIVPQPSSLGITVVLDRSSLVASLPVAAKSISSKARTVTKNIQGRCAT